MLPYGRQQIIEQDIQAVVAVLRSDWLTTGPIVTRFENALSAQTGGHRVVACTSGTAALHTAYATLNVGPGDQVVTSPMTFVATASCASILGADIVFADVTEDTVLLDPDLVAQSVTDRTKVIAGVDYAGQPCDYPALQGIADSVGASTLSDAAHSIGSTRGGVAVGDMADATAFSFFPTKNITTGEGGAVAFKSPEAGQRAHEFHNIGLVRDQQRFELTGEGGWHQEVHEFGLNYRLTDIACALGLVQLARLNEFKRRRREIWDRYDTALADVHGVRRPVRDSEADPTWHLYSLRVLEGRRRDVFDKMRSAGIGVQVNYLPVYWHPVYDKLGYRRGMCPVAEKFYLEELSLPIYPDLTNADVDRVVDVLIRALR